MLVIARAPSAVVALPLICATVCTFFAEPQTVLRNLVPVASENGYARDLAERALAHTIANRTEAAYHRSDLCEQRRPMMEAWAKHVLSL